MVPELLDAIARDNPARCVLRDADLALSAHEASHAAIRLANQLATQGLCRRDRVLIIGENAVATPLLALAAQRLGAWPALVNARVGVGELDAMIACVCPRVLIFATAGSLAALELAATRAVVEWSDPAAGRLLVEVARRETSGAADAGPHADAAPDADVALLLFTSGTTGKAKAVMWSHAGLMTLGRVLAQTRSTTPTSTVQCAAPLSHMMGVSNWMAALAAGATLQLMPRLDAAAMVSAIEAGEITHLSLVPAAYRRLCEYLEGNGKSLVGAGLQYISCGGSPLDEALKLRVETLFGVRLVNGYGMTECAPGSRTRPDIAATADCIGWPEPGVEMRIDALPGETVGELLLRSDTRMLGYFGEPGETAMMLRADGWLATGDLATCATDGSFRIVGRIKDLIIRSGFNVYPAEVEAALQSLPQIDQAAVIGCPTTDGNEEIVAFVRLRSSQPTSLEAIRHALVGRLAPYKHPGRIEVIDEFPLGPTGKVAKKVLIDRWVRNRQA